MQWFKEVRDTVPKATIIFVGVVGRLSETDTLDE